jgi:hypothetical protein
MKPSIRLEVGHKKIHFFLKHAGELRVNILRRGKKQHGPKNNKI